MTPEEIVSGIAKIGGDVTRPTLTRYEHWGLLSKPKRGSMGRGLGRWTNYPEVTIAEAFTAWSMINAKYPISIKLKTPIRLPPETVYAARGSAISRYKHNEPNDLNEVVKCDGYMEIINWENENGFIEYLDLEASDRGADLKSIYIRLISFASRLWDFEFRRSYNLYINYKSQ